MDNSIDNITFKANLNVLTHFSNNKKLNSVAKIFKNRTKNMPNDNLYITKAPNNVISLHISNKKVGDFYKGSEIFTDNLNEELETLSPKDFAKKLINAFKALKLHDENYKKIIELRSEIINLGKQLAQNINKSKVWLSDNKLYSKRFEVLADNNKRRIEQLANEIQKYEKKINNLSKNFEDIKNLI